MKITSPKFYRLALLIPYLTLIVLLPIFYFNIGSDYINSSTSVDTPAFVQAFQFVLGLLLGTLAIVSIIYILGAPYWLVPYTILVIFLWVWSLKKNKSQMYKMFIWSPIFLAALTTGFYLLVSNLFPSMNYLGDDIPASSAICIFPSSIVLGYLFIGMTAWIYDSLRRRGMIIDEENILNLNDTIN